MLEKIDPGQTQDHDPIHDRNHDQDHDLQVVPEPVHAQDLALLQPKIVLLALGMYNKWQKILFKINF